MRSFTKSFSRIAGRFFELFFAFLFVYLLVAVLGAVIPVGHLRENGEVTIFVRSNGVHTDVCLPVQTAWMNWLDFIPIEDYPEDAPCDYIMIGWGDKGFFLDTPTWAELKVSTALNAAVIPSEAAMHVEYTEMPVTGEFMRRVHVSVQEYRKLVRFVKSSFRRSRHDVEIIRGAGYTAYDRFYEANYSYHMFNTCNSWTNSALKSAEVRTGMFALFPDGIMSHLPQKE